MEVKEYQLQKIPIEKIKTDPINPNRGTTLIVCERMNRICYACEIDPAYCDVIIKRWEAYTGKKAELLNG